MLQKDLMKKKLNGPDGLRAMLLETPAVKVQVKTMKKEVVVEHIVEYHKSDTGGPTLVQFFSAGASATGAKK